METRAIDSCKNLRSCCILQCHALHVRVLIVLQRQCFFFENRKTGLDSNPISKARFPLSQNTFRNAGSGCGRLYAFSGVLRFRVCFALANLLGSVLGRTDFSRISILEPPDFFADLVAGFLSKERPEKNLQENWRQSLQILCSKSPRHFSAEGPGQNLGSLVMEFSNGNRNLG